MPNPSIRRPQPRILIADTDTTRRFGVEKMLNHFGYYGVATATSFEELTTLLGFPGKPFDAVLVSCDLLEPGSPETWKILHQQPNVFMYRNGLFTGRINDPAALITEGLSDFSASLPTLH